MIKKTLGRFIIMLLIIYTASGCGFALLKMLSFRLIKIEKKYGSNTALFRGSDGKTSILRKGEKLEGWQIDEISEGLVVLKNDDQTVRIRPHSTSAVLRRSGHIRYPEKISRPPAERTETVNGFNLIGIYGEGSSRYAEITYYGGVPYTVKRGEVKNGFKVTGLSKTTLVMKPAGGGDKITLTMKKMPGSSVRERKPPVPAVIVPGGAAYTLAGIMKTGSGYTAIIKKGTASVYVKRGEKVDDYVVDTIKSRQVKLTSPGKMPVILELSE